MSDRTKWSNSDNQRRTTDTSGNRSSRNDLGRPSTDVQEKQEYPGTNDATVHRNDAGKPNTEADQKFEGEGNGNDKPETEKGFANQELLEQHHNDHSKEFNPPFENKEAYEDSAKNFMHSEQNAQTLEKTRASNGDRIRYNQSTEEFGVARKDGTIRTYFIPDPAKHGYATNREYYDAQ